MCAGDWHLYSTLSIQPCTKISPLCEVKNIDEVFVGDFVRWSELLLLVSIDAVVVIVYRGRFVIISI